MSSGRGTASAKARRRASDRSWTLAQLLQTGECPGGPPSSPCLLPHRPRPSLWPCPLLLSGFLSLSSCPVRPLSPACLFSEGSRGLYQGSPSTPLLPCPPPRSGCVCRTGGHRGGASASLQAPHTPQMLGVPSHLLTRSVKSPRGKPSLNQSNLSVSPCPAGALMDTGEESHRALQVLRDFALPPRETGACCCEQRPDAT